MNQVEVKSKQIQAIVSVFGLVTWLVLGSMIGDNGIAYFAVATEGFLIFYDLLAGRLAEALGRVLRTRYAKGQFKNADKVKSSVLIFQASLGVLGGILLFFLAPVLAEKVFLIPYGTFPLQILAFVLVIRVVMHIFLGYLQGSGTQMPVVVVQFLRYILYFGFTFLFVKMFREYGKKVELLLLNDSLPSMYGAAGMAVAVAVTELLLLLFVLFLYVISRKAQRKQTEGLKKTETFKGAVGSLYGAMSSLFLADLLIRLPLWLGMILYMRSVEDVQAATVTFGKFYGKYLVVCMIPILICGSLIHSLAFRTVKAMRKGELRYAKDILGAGFHMGIVITLFPAVYLTVLSTQVGHMIEGTKGAMGELGKMFLIGSFVIMLVVLSQFFVRCILYLGKWRYVLLTLGMYVLVFVLSEMVCLQLIKSGIIKSGIEGLIYSGLAAFLVLGFSAGMYLFRQLRIKPDYLYWIGIPALASVAAGLVCFLLGRFVTPHMGYPFTVIVGFVVGLILYWVILLICRSFRRQELEVMPGGWVIEKLLELLVK